MQPGNCPRLEPPRCPAGDPCKCICLNPEAVTYVQPKPPASCAPKQVFRQPKVPIEGSTVYKKSYPGFPVDVARNAKAELCRPDEGPIKVPGVIDGNTTNSLSYQYPQGRRPPPCRPFGSNLMGKGPMADTTTQKDAFTAKPYSKREPFGCPRTDFPHAPMEGWTTSRLSYVHPEGAEPAQSMKPITKVRRVPVPVDGVTIQKASYVQPELPPKEVYPWMQKQPYCKPCIPFAGNTTYTHSFVPPGETVKLDSKCTGDGVDANLLPLPAGYSAAAARARSRLCLTPRPCHVSSRYGCHYPILTCH